MELFMGKPCLHSICRRCVVIGDEFLIEAELFSVVLALLYLLKCIVVRLNVHAELSFVMLGCCIWQFFLFFVLDIMRTVLEHWHNLH